MKPYPTLQLFYLEQPLPQLKYMYFYVTGKVEEIVAVDVLPVYLLRQRLDRVLVRNVLDHQSSPTSPPMLHTSITK